jgi:hypothetical protein
VDDRFRVQFFGSEKRKTILQIETHLVSENAKGSGSGAVIFFDSVIEQMTE